jgi:OFA family oxalate/formate antiporter-like MFS transporter
VFTPIIERLITRFGGAQVGEPKTFMVLAGIFLTVCTVGGFFLKNPPETANPGSASASVAADDSLSPRQVLCDARFYFVTSPLMLACMGGLMMIGFAKPIAVAKGWAPPRR